MKPKQTEDDRRAANRVVLDAVKKCREIIEAAVEAVEYGNGVAISSAILDTLTAELLDEGDYEATDDPVGLIIALSVEATMFLQPKGAEDAAMLQHFYRSDAMLRGISNFKWSRDE